MTTAALTLFCVAQDRRARSAEESFSFTSIRHIGPKTSVKLRSEASCPQSKRPWISPQLQIAPTELHLILRLTADDEIVFQQWDEILRMIATIKLKEVTASDLFRRLNSYSKRHAPYRALEAFGQVPKSLFILQVTDDPVLRQAIEKQMDRIEHAHRFTRAVSVGNAREFLQAEKEDQELAEACKRLIKNCIICWNYLYLSQKLEEIKDTTEREAFLDAVAHGSADAWSALQPAR